MLGGRRRPLTGVNKGEKAVLDLVELLSDPKKTKQAIADYATARKQAEDEQAQANDMMAAAQKERRDVEAMRATVDRENAALAENLREYERKTQSLVDKEKKLVADQEAWEGERKAAGRALADKEATLDRRESALADKELAAKQKEAEAQSALARANQREAEYRAKVAQLKNIVG